MTTIDNDVNEFVTYINGYTNTLNVDTPTSEVLYTGNPANLGGFTNGYESNGTFEVGISVDDPEFQVTAVYSQISSVSFRFGSTDAGGELSNHSIALLPCVPEDNWASAGTLDFPTFYSNIDTDNDGTPDYLDTDSDNDGCFDALEGSATNIALSDLNGNGSIDYANTTPSGVDANGVPNLANGGSGKEWALLKMIQQFQPNVP